MSAQVNRPIVSIFSQQKYCYIILRLSKSHSTPIIFSRIYPQNPPPIINLHYMAEVKMTYLDFTSSFHDYSRIAYRLKKVFGSAYRICHYTSHTVLLRSNQNSYINCPKPVLFVKCQLITTRFASSIGKLLTIF